GLGLEHDPAFKAQQDRNAWPDLKTRVAALVKQRTRDQWCEILEGADACFAPVMSLAEAPQHPHNVARETFITVGGVTQPAPAPRYTRQALDTPKAATEAGVDTDEVLAACGFEPQRIADLRKSGALG
ncbi:MAG: CoA transferase, partial [Caulobacter sp.]